MVAVPRIIDSWLAVLLQAGISSISLTAFFVHLSNNNLQRWRTPSLHRGGPGFYRNAKILGVAGYVHL
jgi:hypothetical protein